MVSAIRDSILFKKKYAVQLGKNVHIACHRQRQKHTRMIHTYSKGCPLNHRQFSVERDNVSIVCTHSHLHTKFKISVWRAKVFTNYYFYLNLL